MVVDRDILQNIQITLFSLSPSSLNQVCDYVKRRVSFDCVGCNGTSHRRKI